MPRQHRQTVSQPHARNLAPNVRCLQEVLYDTSYSSGELANACLEYLSKNNCCNAGWFWGTMIIPHCKHHYLRELQKHTKQRLQQQFPTAQVVYLPAAMRSCADPYGGDAQLLSQRLSHYRGQALQHKSKAASLLQGLQAQHAVSLSKVAAARESSRCAHSTSPRACVD